MQKQPILNRPVRSQTHNPEKLLRMVNADLRSSSGRLDAIRIAEAFNLTISETGRALRTSAAKLKRKSDAKPFQEKLIVFAKIGQLRVIAALDRGFIQHWIRKRLPVLNGRTPLWYILNGKGEVISNLAPIMFFGECL